MAKRMVVLPEEVYNNYKKAPIDDPVEKRLTELANEMTTILHSYGFSDENIYFEYDQRLKEFQRLLKRRADQGAGGSLFDKMAELLQKLTEKTAGIPNPGGGSGGPGGSNGPQPPPPPSSFVIPKVERKRVAAPTQTTGPLPPVSAGAVRAAIENIPKQVASKRKAGSPVQTSEPKIPAHTSRPLPHVSADVVKTAIANIPKQVSLKRKAGSSVYELAPKVQDVDTNVEMSAAAPLPVSVKTEVMDDYEWNVKPTAKKEVLEGQPLKMDISDALENRVKTVRDKVMADPAKYGITPKGLIKGDNKAVYRSSFVESLRYLLTGERGSAPPGTEHLRQNLLDHPELAKIIPAPSTAVSTTKQRIAQRTSERERPPRGHHTTPFKVDRFRPALWSISSSAKQEPAELDPEIVGRYTWTSERIKARRKPKVRTKPQTNYPKSWAIPDRHPGGRRS